MKEYLSAALILSMVMSLMLEGFTQSVSSSQQTLEKGAIRMVAVGEIEVA